MSVNTNSEGVAAPAAKHRGRSTEGSVRVLGQTAAVAGISGALLLALKAMVLVSPAVLPNSDGLDALGRPNAIVDTSDSTAPPVIFAPAANPIAQGPAPVGSSERTGLRSPSSSSPVTTPSNDVAGESKDSTKPKPSTPSTPSTGSDDDDAPKGPLGQVAKPVTDVLKKPSTVTETLTDPVKELTSDLPVGDVVGDVADGANNALDGAGGTVGKLADDATGAVDGLAGGVTGLLKK